MKFCLNKVDVNKMMVEAEAALTAWLTTSPNKTGRINDLDDVGK